jgi:hypothetical protein
MASLPLVVVIDLDFPWLGSISFPPEDLALAYPGNSTGDPTMRQHRNTYMSSARSQGTFLILQIPYLHRLRPEQARIIVVHLSHGAYEVIDLLTLI